MNKSMRRITVKAELQRDEDRRAAHQSARQTVEWLLLMLFVGLLLALFLKGSGFIGTNDQAFYPA
jgi:hypothetical protein